MSKPKRAISRSGRTPLFSALRRCIELARIKNRHASMPFEEITDRTSTPPVDRRTFLSTLSLAGVTLAAGKACRHTERAGGPGDPRIVIVGAGIAGLNAAYQLQKAGVYANIYEASNRTGGRIYSAHDIMAPGMTTEVGAEFIDSTHRDLLDLIDEFGLELYDRTDPSESHYKASYFFRGRHYSEAEVVEAFRPIAAKIEADYNSLDDRVDFRHEGGAAKLDRTSLREYLDRAGATGWFRDLLDVAFVTEYGLDSDQQSCLNLILLISTDLSNNQFNIFGESDERFKVKGGNQRIVDELAVRVKYQIHTGYFLESIRARGRGYALTFNVSGGQTVDVDADMVLLTVPFTLLKNIDWRVDLPAYKTKAIRELGYGTNAKLMAGMKKRIWRESGYSGELFTDEAFQLCWDNSQMQEGPAGGMTLYSGGELGLVVGTQTAHEQVDRLFAGVDRAFPGAANQLNGNVKRFHWPTYPYSLASYACYKPGQYTTIRGAEIEPVGNLFFAGEHTSLDFQGFMNGGAETGKRAALDMLGQIDSSKAQRMARTF